MLHNYLNIFQIIMFFLYSFNKSTPTQTTRSKIPCWASCKAQKARILWCHCRLVFILFSSQHYLTRFKTRFIFPMVCNPFTSVSLKSPSKKSLYKIQLWFFLKYFKSIHIKSAKTYDGCTNLKIFLVTSYYLRC